MTAMSLALTIPSSAATVAILCTNAMVALLLMPAPLAACTPAATA